MFPRSKTKDMKTIAELLNIKDFPFIIKDKNDNVIYNENAMYDWEKAEYNSAGQKTYSEDSEGTWAVNKYNEAGQKTYFENSDGDWVVIKYNKAGEKVSSESSDD